MSEGGADSVADLEAEAAAVAEEEVSVAAEEEEAVEADLAEGTNKEDEEEDHPNKDSHMVLPASMDLRSLMIIDMGLMLWYHQGNDHLSSDEHTTCNNLRRPGSSAQASISL